MRTMTLLLTAALATAGCDSPDLEIGPRLRSSPALRSVDSCDDLESTLRAAIKEEMRVRLLQTLADDDYGLRGNAELMARSADSGSAQGGGREQGTDYSGTNNQEPGVDEADFVKTDGYHIYVLNGDRFEILGVPEFGELTEVSTTELEGLPSQMLIGDDRAVVFSTINAHDLEEGHPLRDTIGDESWARDGCWYPVANVTKITVLDITDRAAPALMHELYLEGHYQTARKVDSSVRMVSYVWMEIPGLLYWPELPVSYWDDVDWFGRSADDEFTRAVLDAIRRNNNVINSTPLADLVPAIYQRRGGEIVAHAFTDAACSGFSVAEDATSRGFTSIVSLDLLDDSFSFDADHVVSNSPVVYASSDTLVLAEAANDWWWYWRNDDFLEAANIHRFDTSAVGQAVYQGSGRIDGTVQNQFSLSEHDGYIRVAATTGRWNRWWMADPDPSENHVYVLGGDGALRTLGHLGGIGMDEQIWSARFVGDKAFLVTFRNIDPLWTIDLSDPVDPRIIGELEIPGVSTYIHPVDDGTLLTIGFGGTDTGLDWSNQVSLFDVSSFANPALDDSLRLGTPGGNNWNWSWSEATYEHKAFQYWAPEDLLAVPVATYRWSNSRYEYYSRLELINVDLTGNLSLYGAVDHTPFYDHESHDYRYNPEIRRSIFMGDFIYAVSDRAVTAHRLSDLAMSASVRLPGTPYHRYGW